MEALGEQFSCLYFPETKQQGMRNLEADLGAGRSVLQDFLLCWSFLQILSQILSSPMMIQTCSLIGGQASLLGACHFCLICLQVYCSSFLGGLPSSSFHLLQTILHMAARICFFKQSPPDH